MTLGPLVLKFKTTEPWAHRVGRRPQIQGGAEVRLQLFVWEIKQ